MDSEDHKPPREPVYHDEFWRDHIAPNEIALKARRAPDLLPDYEECDWQLALKENFTAPDMTPRAMPEPPASSDKSSYTKSPLKPLSFYDRLRLERLEDPSNSLDEVLLAIATLPRHKPYDDVKKRRFLPLKDENPDIIAALDEAAERMMEWSIRQIPEKNVGDTTITSTYTCILKEMRKCAQRRAGNEQNSSNDYDMYPTLTAVCKAELQGIDNNYPEALASCAKENGNFDTPAQTLSKIVDHYAQVRSSALSKLVPRSSRWAY